MEPADAIHEIIPRSLEPGTWQRLDNRIPLCRRHHDQVHADGTAAWAERLRERAAALLELLT